LAIDPVSDLKAALGANWPKIKPFVMTSADQFRAPPPPSLKDEAYKQTFNEEVRIGGDPAHGTNTSRTEPQTFIAKFWGTTARRRYVLRRGCTNMIARTIALQQKMRRVPTHRRVGVEIFLPILAASYSNSRTIRRQIRATRRSRHQHAGSEFHAAVSGLSIRPRNIRRCLVPDPAPILAGRNSIYFCFG
jgi:hypothetical protein